MPTRLPARRPSHALSPTNVPIDQLHHRTPQYDQSNVFGNGGPPRGRGRDKPAGGTQIRVPRRDLMRQLALAGETPEPASETFSPILAAARSISLAGMDFLPIPDSVEPVTTARNTSASSQISGANMMSNMISRPAVRGPSPAPAVTNVPIEQLHLDPRNPRVHKPKQIRSIAESIKQFGFIAPVVTDGQGRIIAGHGRVLAAKKLGWIEVPTISVEHLSEPQIRAYQIADNKLTENAGWNDQLLGEIFLELSTLDLEFSTDITGFSVGEIDLLIEGIGLDDNPKPDGADRLPPSLPGPAVTVPGDLWLPGRHRLLCGDARDPRTYQTLMQGSLADMVFIDPPFNVAIQGHASGLGASTHREFAVAGGEMTSAEYGKFLTDSMRLLADHSRDGSLHYIFTDWRQIGVLLAAADDVYAEHHNICI
jgi:hypothetical protein